LLLQATDVLVRVLKTIVERVKNMAKRAPKPLKRRRKSNATTPEERESELISLAYDLVEQRMRDGTATAAETVHFLKLGSSREKLEREVMEQKKDYEAAKTENLASQRNAEEQYLNAIRAFRKYSGTPEDDEEDYD
jgi:hypothetical protein